MPINAKQQQALNDLVKFVPVLGKGRTGTVILLGDMLAELYADIFSGGVVARIASTANRALTGLAAIDGVTPVAGDVILLKDQTDPKQNGVYVAALGAWARLTDTSGADVVATVGLAVKVAAGSTQADTSWLLTNNAPIVVGTDNLVFVQVVTSGASSIDLASTANGKGASLIGIEDAAGLITAATVEAALLELVKYEPVALADPGTGVAIGVTRSATVLFTIGAGAETNTLAIPTFLGQRLILSTDVQGAGTRAVTSAQAFNQAGNTVMTFAQVRDFITLVAIKVGGAFRWQVSANDGVALS